LFILHNSSFIQITEKARPWAFSARQSKNAVSAWLRIYVFFKAKIRRAIHGAG